MWILADVSIIEMIRGSADKALYEVGGMPHGLRLFLRSGPYLLIATTVTSCLL